MRFIVVCEGDTDQWVACELADRIIVDSCSSWLERDTLELLRSWTGLDANSEHRYLKWCTVPDLAKQHRVHAHGNFRDEKAKGDAQAARKALLLIFRCADPQPDAVVLVRDADDDPDRLEGLRRARASTPQSADQSANTSSELSPWGFALAIGCPLPKIESWILAGFEPQDDSERRRLDELKRKLGLDPCCSAHRLSTAEHGADKNIKRVLAMLVNGAHDRERRCVDSADLDLLRARGEHTNLKDYLCEIEKHLVPLFDARQRPPLNA